MMKNISLLGFMHIKQSYCNVFHHSMKPENNYFNSYVYITFYIISQISNIILHPSGLVFLILRIKYNLIEVLEQP